MHHYDDADIGVMWDLLQEVPKVRQQVEANVMPLRQYVPPQPPKSDRGITID